MNNSNIHSQNLSKWFLCDNCLKNKNSVKMYNSINSPWYLKNYLKEIKKKIYLCNKCTPNISFYDIVNRNNLKKI